MIVGLKTSVMKTGDKDNHETYNKVLSIVNPLYKKRAEIMEELNTDQMKNDFLGRTREFFCTNVFEETDNFLIIVEKEEDLSFFLLIKHKNRENYYWIRYFSHSNGKKYENDIVEHAIKYFREKTISNCYIYGYNRRKNDAELIEYYKSMLKCIVVDDVCKFPEGNDFFSNLHLDITQYSCLYFRYPYENVFIMVKDGKDKRLKSVIAADFENWETILKTESPVKFTKVDKKKFNIEYLERKVFQRKAIKKLFIVYNGHAENDGSSLFPNPFKTLSHKQLLEMLKEKKYDFLCVGYDSCNSLLDADDDEFAKGNFGSTTPNYQTLNKLWNFNGTIQFCSSSNAKSWASTKNGSYFTLSLTSNLKELAGNEGLTAKECWEHAFLRVKEVHNTSISFIENMTIEESINSDL